MRINKVQHVCLLPLLFALAGCQTVCKQSTPCDACYQSSFHHPQISRGESNPLIDTLGAVVGIPEQIFLMDSRANNHQVSRKTETTVLRYLENNQLNSVLVRVNQYDPVGEWQRLMTNDRISPFTRFSVGTYDWLKYTLVPGRILGGDNYSPYTDSLHLYSDLPSLALTKAAYAKDVHTRDAPSVYSFVQSAPIVGLWSDGKAYAEAINHISRYGSEQDLSEAQRILLPDMVGTFSGEALRFFPFGSSLGRAGGALSVQVARGGRQIAERIVR